MTKADSATFQPKTLAQHFDPPDDFVGRFGWICGYSADAAFLENVTERFTQLIASRRAHDGRIALALMLDPGNPQITLVDVPSLLHLPIKVSKPPFKLLHAKVALLGFRHSDSWCLRLIVSTGNWTRQTLEDSLDLAWVIEIHSEELKSPSDKTKQACADFRAAWDMLSELRKLFDDRTLNSADPDRSETDSTVAMKDLDGWIKRAVSIGRRMKPRFFDSRRKSLLDQLPELIKLHGRKSVDDAVVARNYLAMGSGFYESVNGTNDIPLVLKTIVEGLKQEELLTRNADINVFVNPASCQAVAESLTVIGTKPWENWKLRPPGPPQSDDKPVKTLHAKFIFSANDAASSYFCNSAWLYLGSGNLTHPGFLKKMSPNGGNLEAGVLFAPEGLRWYAAVNGNDEDVITNRLPIQYEDEIPDSADALKPGTDMEERESEFTAAPIAYLISAVNGETCCLTPSDSDSRPFDVLNSAGIPCDRDNEQRFVWVESPPRIVQVQWTEGDQTRLAWVPVIDHFGRIAATTLRRIDLDEAWSQLDHFPMPPPEEELVSEADDGTDSDGVEQRASRSQTADYPIRQMMQLIENIAAKQTAVSQNDWIMWCTRLEQCLTMASKNLPLEEFKKLELNPLSPLREIPFRPAFAENDQTKEGLHYENVLARIEVSWKVGGLNRIGSTHNDEDETEI